MNLTPELVSDILVRQGYLTPEQGETIKAEAKAAAAAGCATASAFEQKALAYELILQLRLPNQRDSGGALTEHRHRPGDRRRRQARPHPHRHPEPQRRPDRVQDVAAVRQAPPHDPARHGQRQAAGGLANPYDMEGIDSFQRIAGRDADVRRRLRARHPQGASPSSTACATRSSAPSSDLNSGIDLGNLEQLSPHEERDRDRVVRPARRQRRRVHAPARLREPRVATSTSSPSARRA